MQKLQLFLFGLAAIIFFIFILILSYYNRIACDDFIISNNALKFNALACGVSHYFHWQGTFFISWFEHAVLGSLKGFKSTFIFTFGTFLLLLHSIYYLINRLFYNFYIKILFAIIFSSCFFYMSYDYGQTSWFWVCGSTRYIYPLILLLYITGFLFRNKNNKIGITNFFILVGFFILGFSTLNYGVIILFYFTSIIVFHFYYSHSYSLWAYVKTNNTMILSYIVFFIGFLIMLIAPGNFERLAYSKTLLSNKSIIDIFISSNIYNFKVLIKDKLPIMLIFVLCFLPLIENMRLKNILYRIGVSRIFFLIFFLLISIYLLQTFVMAYVLKSEGPFRTYTIISFALALVCLLMSFLLYNFFSKMNSKYKTVAIYAGVILLLSLNILIVRKYILTSIIYAGAFDEMVVNITNNKTSGKIIYLSSLPNSGLLYSTTMASDTLSPIYMWNKEMEQYYGVKSKILIINP